MSRGSPDDVTRSDEVNPSVRLTHGQRLKVTEADLLCLERVPQQPSSPSLTDQYARRAKVCMFSSAAEIIIAHTTSTFSTEQTSTSDLTDRLNFSHELGFLQKELLGTWFSFMLHTKEKN